MVDKLISFGERDGVRKCTASRTKETEPREVLIDYMNSYKKNE